MQLQSAVGILIGDTRFSGTLVTVHDVDDFVVNGKPIMSVEQADDIILVSGQLKVCRLDFNMNAVTDPRTSPPPQIAFRDKDTIID